MAYWSGRGNLMRYFYVYLVHFGLYQHSVDVTVAFHAHGVDAELKSGHWVVDSVHFDTYLQFVPVVAPFLAHAVDADLKSGH